MSVAVVVLSYAVGMAALLDAWRRPQSEWIEADRNRNAWLVRLTLMTVLAFGLFIGIGYAAYALPALEKAKRSLADSGGSAAQFRKGDAG